MDIGSALLAHAKARFEQLKDILNTRVLEPVEVAEMEELRGDLAASGEIAVVTAAPVIEEAVNAVSLVDQVIIEGRNFHA
jgi:hypothetical protein